MNSLSTAQLAEYLQVTKRTIQRRANREQWAFVKRIGLGGTRRMYTFASLPANVKQIVINRIVTKHELQGFEFNTRKPIKPVQSKTSLPDSPYIVKPESTTNEWLDNHVFAKQSSQALDFSQLNKDYIKVGLLVLAQLYVIHFATGKIKGLDELAKLYNTRQLAIHEAIYCTVKSISRITLLRWEKQFNENGTRYQFLGSTQTQQTLDSDLYSMANELLLTSPNLTAKNLRQYFITIFPDRKIPSTKHLSQWLKQHKSQE